MIMVYVCPSGHQNFQQVKVQQAGCLSHGPTIICKTCFGKASYNDDVQTLLDAAVLKTIDATGATQEELELPPDPERVM